MKDGCHLAQWTASLAGAAQRQTGFFPPHRRSQGPRRPGRLQRPESWDRKGHGVNQPAGSFPEMTSPTAGSPLAPAWDSASPEPALLGSTQQCWRGTGPGQAPGVEGKGPSPQLLWPNPEPCCPGGLGTCRGKGPVAGQT